MVKNPMSPVARDVRAAAQLRAESADRDDANLVAVLFAEERHRAARDRLFGGPDFGLYRRVPVDLFVDDPLDLVELRARDRCEVDEIKSQPVGRHE